MCGNVLLSAALTSHPMALSIKSLGHECVITCSGNGNGGYLVVLCIEVGVTCRTKVISDISVLSAGSRNLIVPLEVMRAEILNKSARAFLPMVGLVGLELEAVSLLFKDLLTRAFVPVILIIGLKLIVVEILALVATAETLIPVVVFISHKLKVVRLIVGGKAAGAFVPMLFCICLNLEGVVLNVCLVSAGAFIPVLSLIILFLKVVSLGILGNAASARVPMVVLIGCKLKGVSYNVFLTLTGAFVPMILLIALCAKGMLIKVLGKTASTGLPMSGLIVCNIVEVIVVIMHVAAEALVPVSLAIGLKLVGMCLKSGLITALTLVPMTFLIRGPSGAVGVSERLYLVIGIASVTANAGIGGIAALGAGGSGHEGKICMTESLSLYKRAKLTVGGVLTVSLDPGVLTYLCGKDNRHILGYALDLNGIDLTSILDLGFYNGNSLANLESVLNADHNVEHSILALDNYKGVAEEGLAVLIGSLHGNGAFSAGNGQCIAASVAKTVGISVGVVSIICSRSALTSMEMESLFHCPGLVKLVNVSGLKRN